MLKHLQVDDVVVASLRFENGAIGTMEASWYLPLTGDFSRNCLLDVFGTQGRIHLEPYSRGLTVYPGTKPWSRPVADYAYEPVVPGVFPSVYRSEVEHFVRCVNTGDKPIATAEEGLASLAVVDAVERSLKEKREVSLK